MCSVLLILVFRPLFVFSYALLLPLPLIQLLPFWWTPMGPPLLTLNILLRNFRVPEQGSRETRNSFGVGPLSAWPWLPIASSANHYANLIDGYHARYLYLTYLTRGHRQLYGCLCLGLIVLLLLLLFALLPLQNVYNTHRQLYSIPEYLLDVSPGKLW